MLVIFLRSLKNITYLPDFVSSGAWESTCQFTIFITTRIISPTLRSLGRNDSYRRHNISSDHTLTCRLEKAPGLASASIFYIIKNLRVFYMQLQIDLNLTSFHMVVSCGRLPKTKLLFYRLVLTARCRWCRYYKAIRIFCTIAYMAHN